MSTVNITNIKRRLKERGLSDEQIGDALSKRGLNPNRDTQEIRTGVAGFVIGAGKELLGTARGVAQAGQKIGKGVLSLIPGVSKEAVEKTGFKSLDERTEEGRGVSELLTPRGKAERAGAKTAFAAEFALPLGGALKTVKGAQALKGGAKVGERAVRGAGDVVKRTGEGVADIIIGPTGRRGLGQRFRRPTEVEAFLKTLKGRAGGKPVESLTQEVRKGAEVVKKRAGVAFEKAEAKIVSKKISKPSIVTGGKEVVRDFLKLDKLTKSSIAKSGLSDSEVKVVNRIVEDLDKLKDFSTKGVLALKRKISKLPRKRGTPVDALVSKMTGKDGIFNKLIQEADPKFRTALKAFSEEKRFLDQLNVDVLSKSSKSADAATNKIVQIAKTLDDPTKREGAERLLRSLESKLGKGGPQIIEQLRDLATALDLAPPGSKGLRAGIIREIVRIAQNAVSSIIGVAGKGAQAVSKVKGTILETLKTSSRTPTPTPTISPARAPQIPLTSPRGRKPGVLQRELKRRAKLSQ